MRGFRFRANSGEIARRRLASMLVSDRTSCPPELLDMIRNDFLKSVSRYLEIDANQLTFQMIRRPDDGPDIRMPALCACIPVPDLHK